MFNTYMGMLIWPMIAFGWVVNLMQRGTASLERINEIAARAPVDRGPADLPLTERAHSAEIRFRDVLMRSFGAATRWRAWT